MKKAKHMKNYKIDKNAIFDAAVLTYTGALLICGTNVYNYSNNTYNGLYILDMTLIGIALADMIHRSSKQLREPKYVQEAKHLRKEKKKWKQNTI